MNLLKQVMLLLTHDKIAVIAASLCGIFLSLFKLILQRLGIDTHTSVTNDLLARIRGYGTSTGCRKLPHTLNAGIER